MPGYSENKLDLYIIGRTIDMLDLYPPLVELSEAALKSPHIVFVCEHASNKIPEQFNGLGIDEAAQQSHIAWDPGALGVARALKNKFSGDLVAGSVSRLLYDCNRPPESPTSIPPVSEIFKVPGNEHLTQAQRLARVAGIYEPFCKALTQTLSRHKNGILVTIHSFTPVYHGVSRSCEVGLLHDADTRLTDAMLTAVAPTASFKVERNVPYSAHDGVTHTLKLHAIPRGWLNVMIEIRNDLIKTKDEQEKMADFIAAMLAPAIQDVKENSNV